MTIEQKNFCKAVYKAAAALYQADKDNCVSPLFTTAQAMLESGWGKSAIGNNLFGMTVGSSWNGAKRLVTTREVFSTANKKFTAPECVISVTPLKNGRFLYRCKRLFRDYSSLEEGLRDHNALFRKAIYADAWPYRLRAKEFAVRISDLNGGRYATDPMYSRTMCRMIDIVSKIVKEESV